MKVSVNWLKEFTDIDVPIGKLVERIGAQLGAVDEVIDLSRKYKGIIVAKVVSRHQHPGADKLSICLIDDSGKVKGVKRDKRGLVQVVCGAPNVRPELLVAWIPPGVAVPSSFDKEPLVVETREIRGQVSHGMLASAQELDIGDDHSGVVELPPAEAKPGDDFASVYQLNDHIVDIENKMFTHRPDCFGVLGVAREVAGIHGRRFTSPDWYKQFNANLIRPPAAELELAVVNELTDLVPRFTAVVLKDVTVQASPLWLQTYLARVGVRPINNVVDLTNYYMVLTGQPLHAYDYDKLPSRSLETRLSKKGEKLKLLGGKEIRFTDDRSILITSGGRPVGLGGVMGGQETAVDEATRNIVLEGANFDMFSIRRTSMAHGLFTDAVTCFSKGQSPLQTDRVVAKAALDMEKKTGGKIASRLFDEKMRLKPPLAVHARADFINARLGFDKTALALAETLKNVEFEVKINGPTLTVTPPFWRTDIAIPEDVVEEIGRLIGFDQLPMTLPRRVITPPERNKLLDIKARVRTILSAAGANEVLTYSFVHGDLLGKAGQDVKRAFKLTNAISPDLQYYRLSLTPSLLGKVYPNIKTGFDEFAIFEIGKTHNKACFDAAEKLPKEIEKIALVYAAKKPAPGAPIYRARVFLDELLNKLNIRARYEPINSELELQTARPFAKERAARVVYTTTNEALGIIGEYRDSVRTLMKLPENVSGFELFTAKLLAASAVDVYSPLSRFPGVEQDMTLRVPSGLAFSDLDASLANAVANTVDTEKTRISWRVTDIYQAQNDSHKHLTYRFKVTPYDRTLKATEVNALLDEIATAVGERQKAKRV